MLEAKKGQVLNNDRYIFDQLETIITSNGTALKIKDKKAFLTLDCTRGICICNLIRHYLLAAQVVCRLKEHIITKVLFLPDLIYSLILSC